MIFSVCIIILIGFEITDGKYMYVVQFLLYLDYQANLIVK